MPRLRYAEPHSTTTASPAPVSSRSAARSVASETAAPAQYSSSAWGCSSATVSSSARRRRSASARRDSGTGRSSYAPVSAGHTTARIRTRSTTPSNPSSRPIGSCTTRGVAPSRSRIDATAESRSAPARSILFTNARRGTPCRSASRHTASLCGSTPATASNTATAPSRTRSERVTSSAKSTWPGVSMRLIRCPSQSQLTAAAKMVMPRSRSWESKSVTVVPSCTSPRLWTAPVRNRIRSVTVVLPASTWARMPRLRTAWSARSVRSVRTALRPFFVCRQWWRGSAMGGRGPRKRTLWPTATGRWRGRAQRRSSTGISSAGRAAGTGLTKTRGSRRTVPRGRRQR